MEIGDNTAGPSAAGRKTRHAGTTRLRIAAGVSGAGAVAVTALGITATRPSGSGRSGSSLE